MSAPKKISLGKMFQKKPAKKYGLILSKNKKAAPIAAPLDFFKQAAKEADADRGKAGVNRGLVASASSDRAKRQAEQAQAAALAQDASVYDYDGVYDSIQEERKQALENHSLVQSTERQRKVSRYRFSTLPPLPCLRQESKYIASMLEKSKIREREQDRIFEKRLLKEREEEDKMYGDKEKFVTSSYKAKLLENKKWEAEDRRAQEMEEKDDVRKKKGLHGFYAGLLTKNTAMGGDMKHATSAYTSGTKRTDDEGRIITEREVKRAKLEEDVARQRVTEESAKKKEERDGIETAKQDIKEQREKAAKAAQQKSQEDAAKAKKKAAETAAKSKEDKMAAIRAAKERFANRKKGQLNKPLPSEQ
jgi:coiled-coil domain-containing protein 55